MFVELPATHLDRLEFDANKALARETPIRSLDDLHAAAGDVVELIKALRDSYAHIHSLGAK